LDLEGFVEDAVESLAGHPDPILVDVPSGGGTLLPLLERSGFAGVVVETDIAARMLARGVSLRESLPVGIRTVFLRCDALDLPMDDAAADAVVSINGLPAASCMSSRVSQSPAVVSG